MNKNTSERKKIVKPYYKYKQEAFTNLVKAVEDIALAIELVMCFQLAIILFSFDYTKKQGVFQQVTYTMEQLLMLLFPKEYTKAVALDGKKVDHGI